MQIGVDPYTKTADIGTGVHGVPLKVYETS